MIRKMPETYEEKAGEIDLLPCPFCGTDEARFTSCQELEACEDWKCPEESHYHAVVCSFAGKGCGASSGFYPTYREAAEAWNRRSSPRITVSPAEIGNVPMENVDVGFRAAGMPPDTV